MIAAKTASTGDDRGRLEVTRVRITRVSAARHSSAASRSQRRRPAAAGLVHAVNGVTLRTVEDAMNTAAQPGLVQPAPSLVTTVHAVYALHTISLAIGAFGAASVVGTFLFGWPSIIAVILSYVKRGEARGTWLESHFDWQIRTFWWAALWSACIAAVSALLLVVLVGFATWFVGLFALGIWAIYRIARGWLRLNARRAI